MRQQLRQSNNMPFTSLKIDTGSQTAATSGFTPASSFGSVSSQQPPSLAQKIWGGLSKVVSWGEQPFISLAATPIQGLAKAVGQPDPYAQGIPAGLPTPMGLPGSDVRANVSPLSLKAKAGDILKAGSEVAALAAAPATVPGAIGVGAGIGAAQGAGTALQQEQPISEVARKGVIGGLIGGATAGIVSGIGKLVGAVGGKIQNSIIKPTKADIEDGFSIDTIKKYNLGGPLNKTLTKTQNKLTDLTNQLNTKLAESPNRIDINNVYQQTVKELTDSSKLKGFGANTKIANTLEQLKNEITIATPDGLLNIPEAQIVKQASGGFGAWQYGKPDPDSKATEIVFNTFYNKLKTAIEQASPEGVKGINQELSQLIPVMNAIIRRLPVAERSNLISLNEMIGLVGSAVNPIALGPTLLALLSKSGTAANALSKVSQPIVNTAIPSSLVTSNLAEQVSNIQQ